MFKKTREYKSKSKAIKMEGPFFWKEETNEQGNIMAKSGLLEAEYSSETYGNNLWLFYPSCELSARYDTKKEHRENNARLEVGISGFKCDFINY